MFTTVLDITSLAAVEDFENNYFQGKDFSILVNNAAINPKMKETNSTASGRVEDYDMDEWNRIKCRYYWLIYLFENFWFKNG